MPPPKSRTAGAEDRLSRRAASFSSLPNSDLVKTIGRPGSLPHGIGSGSKPSKLLLKVTVQKNLWPIHVMMSPESTVVDLIRATVAAYVSEGRRPLLQDRDPRAFELHFSQFSMESLNREEKVMNLGSRNFFLCYKGPEAASSGVVCGEGAEKESLKSLLPLFRFIGVDLRL